MRRHRENTEPLQSDMRVSHLHSSNKTTSVEQQLHYVMAVADPYEVEEFRPPDVLKNISFMIRRIVSEGKERRENRDCTGKGNQGRRPTTCIWQDTSYKPGKTSYQWITA